jgi:hypothetical protein
VTRVVDVGGAGVAPTLLAPTALGANALADLLDHLDLLGVALGTDVPGDLVVIHVEVMLVLPLETQLAHDPPVGTDRSPVLLATAEPEGRFPYLDHCFTIPARNTIPPSTTVASQNPTQKMIPAKVMSVPNIRKNVPWSDMA